MQYDSSTAGAHVVRVVRRRRKWSAQRRTWRRRSRRAQVSAVATILGLLLVVTFIATYITTTLPNQMGQNDLQRDVLVQDQVSQFAAYIQSVASQQVIGAQVSQPVALGSAGAPPFAQQDSGSISAGNQSGSFNVNFTVLGPETFSLPLGYPQGGTWSPTTYCTPSSPVNTLTCTLAGSAHYNFAGNSEAFTLGVTGTGFTAFNVSSNKSSGITFADTGTGGDYLQILGSNDTITLTGIGSGVSNITILGNHDTISIATVGSAAVTILVVGNNDPITFPTGAGSQTVVLKVFGSTDPLAVTDFTLTQKMAAYYNGFNAYDPTSYLCPFANLTSTSSATFGGVGTGSGIGLKVYYNNSVGYTAQKWQNTSCTGTCYFGQFYQNVAQSVCPYFSQIVLPVASQPIPYGSIVVQLFNTYAPKAEVAFDQGSVIYAQPSGLPIFIVPPRLSFSRDVLTVFLPHFTSAPGSESGVGTADLSARLLSTSQFTIPGPQFSFVNQTQITMRIVSPYAAAWYSYFEGFAGLSTFVTCTGANNVCTALYEPGGSLGTVTLRIPVSGITLNLLVGLFSVQIS